MRKFHEMSADEKISLVMDALMGSADARDRVAEAALDKVDQGVVAPARRHQAEVCSVRPLDFGSEARRYIERTARQGTGSAQGLILALLELVLRKERELTAARFGDGGSELDLAALRAERDDLLVRLHRVERELEHVRNEGALEVGGLRERITELEATVLRQDVELTDVAEHAPHCERCQTKIGWTRFLRGHKHCEGCALENAKDSRMDAELREITQETK